MRLVSQEEVGSAPALDGVVAIVGYGNQGRAHALNLRDSGVEVVIGARSGHQSWTRAEKDGFEPMPIGEAASQADLIMLSLPDEHLGEVFTSDVEANLKAGATVAVCHGFALVYGSLRVPESHDVVLAAPKGPGKALREAYLDGRSLIGYAGVWKDVSGRAMQKAIRYARGIGCAGAALFEIDVETETISDLFGEQAVLCGGIPELIKAGYETLVEAGIPEEAAYLETMHEAKLIVDLLYEGGLEKMRNSISPTASFGGAYAGRRIIDESVRGRMRECLDEIRSGRFAQLWLSGKGQAHKDTKAWIKQESDHSIESSGRRIRRSLQ